MPERKTRRALRLMYAVPVACLRDIVAGATGWSAYEQYLAHLHTHHPGLQPMSREELFKSDLTARWDGVRRCC